MQECHGRDRLISIGVAMMNSLMGKSIHGFICIFLLLNICGGITSAAEPERLLIIDDDLGMYKKDVNRDGSYQMPWLPLTDPDGGLEVLYALGEPGTNVLGITCTMGCSSVEVCMASATKILELTGNPDIPVLRGSAVPEELGQPSEAAHFIINTVMSRPGQVECLAKGAGISN